jgi:F-type H+-transporting ATPase subunit b
MANDHVQESKGGSTTLVGIVAGTLMMVGGMYGYKNIPLTFQDGLAAQGLPLNLWKTLAYIGVFLILFPVIKSFFIDPLRNAIQERTSYLEKTFSEAEELRADMAKMKAEYEKRISDTEADAREKIQAQVREAQDLRTTLMADAAKAKETLVAQAQEEIAREKDNVLSALRVEVVNLTMGATEKLLGESVDDARNRKLVEEFIAKAEVPSK